jgi:hypothetical protein
VSDEDVVDAEVEGGWFATLVHDVLEDGVQGPGRIHIHPTFEVHQIAGDRCWCQPVADFSDDLPVVKHRDKLDREGPEDPGE